MVVGYGFRPTEDELVGYYLRHKINGNNRLVEESIKEINICSFDPWELRLQSKYKSSDPIWYFFSKRENKYASGNQQRRRTKSGYWKLTGKQVDIVDQWGKWCLNRGKIGEKRVLGFHRGTSSKGNCDWIIHEYHYTLLPEDQRTYVICRLEYKGDDKNMLIDNAIAPTQTSFADMTHSAGSVVDQPIQGTSRSYSEYDSAIQGNFNMPQSVEENLGYFDFDTIFDYDSANQDQWVNNYFNHQQQEASSTNSDMLWDYEIRQNCDHLVDERRTYTQDNRNDYRPKNPVTGVFSDDDDDTDSSSTNSVGGSSNGSYHTSSTIEAQEKVMNMQRSECEWKMVEDSVKEASLTKTMVKKKQSWWIVLEEMNQRNSKWDYLKNMIIGFLLFISIIGWIVMVG